MAQDGKYGNLDIPGIAEDEPIFILRAQDKAALRCIEHYAVDADRAGATQEFVNSVVDRVKEFAAWQNDNPGKVKVPD